MDSFDLKKYLAEGRLFEEENPIWTIDSFEDSADIEQAGPSYKKAIIDIIKAKHSNILSKDLEKSIEVTNNFWYDEARDNAKGSDPEDIKVSAKEFADSAIEYYEDALMPLAESRLYEAINLDIEDDIAILSGDSGEYEGEIEDGKTSFSIIYDDLDYRISDQYNENNIEDFLGKGHAFVELAKKYDHNWDIERDLVGITIKLK